MVSEDSHFLAIEIATEMIQGPHNNFAFHALSLCQSVSGWHMQPDGSLPAWDRTAPSPQMLASVFRIKGLSKMGYASNVQAFCIKTFNGCVMAAKCFMNLQ